MLTYIYCEVKVWVILSPYLKIWHSCIKYRRLPLCRLRISRYYYLCRSDISLPTFFLYVMYRCISAPSISKTVNKKEWVSRDDFSCPIIFATSYVEVKIRRSHGRHIVCFGYVHVRKSSKQKSKTIKVIYLLSIEQLILYSAQLNPWLFWYAIILSTNKT